MVFQVTVLHGKVILDSLYWTGDNLGKKMNFVMNHAHGAGSIARPVPAV